MPKKPTPKPVKMKRGTQPRCADCSHPRSFHGNALADCKALGCLCPKWMPPEAEPVAS